MLNRVTSIKLPYWVDAIWLLLLSAYIISGITITPFHGDESTQIYMGRDTYYQFYENAWEKVLYSPTSDEVHPSGATQQQLRLLNGTITKYLFGWLTIEQGITLETWNEQWDWGADWVYNQQTNRIPNDSVLQQTRLLSALFLCIATFAMFGIGYMTGGRLSAYLASLFFVLNPAVLVNGRRAMMEGTMLAFTVLLICLSLIWWRKQKIELLITIGIVSALAIASKHTSAFTVVPVFASIGLLIVWQIYKRKHQFKRNIFGFIGAICVCIVVFYVLNPAWWGAPVDRAFEVLDLRSDLLAQQTATFNAYTNLQERLIGFFNHSFFITPMLYEVNNWNTFPEFVMQLENYKSTLLGGIRTNNIIGWLMLGLTILGLLFSIRQIMNQHREYFLLISWALMMLILTIGLTPLEWQRYYLPIHPVVALLTALGIQFIFKLVTQHKGNS